VLLLELLLLELTLLRPRELLPTLLEGAELRLLEEDELKELYLPRPMLPGRLMPLANDVPPRDADAPMLPER
jgi:hypothetical protein